MGQGSSKHKVSLRVRFGNGSDKNKIQRQQKLKSAVKEPVKQTPPKESKGNPEHKSSSKSNRIHPSSEKLFITQRLLRISEKNDHEDKVRFDGLLSDLKTFHKNLEHQPKYFLSHAFPNKNLDEDEAWITPFKKQLHTDLVEGIGLDVLLDEIDNSNFDIYRFEERIYSVNVIVLCTKTLKKKVTSEDAHYLVQSEYKIILDRRRQYLEELEDKISKEKKVINKSAVIKRLGIQKGIVEKEIQLLDLRSKLISAKGDKQLKKAKLLEEQKEKLVNEIKKQKGELYTNLLSEEKHQELGDKLTPADIKRKYNLVSSIIQLHISGDIEDSVPSHGDGFGVIVAADPAAFQQKTPNFEVMSYPVDYYNCFINLVNSIYYQYVTKKERIILNGILKKDRKLSYTYGLEKHPADNKGEPRIVIVSGGLGKKYVSNKFGAPAFSLYNPKGKNVIKILSQSNTPYSQGLHHKLLELKDNYLNDANLQADFKYYIPVLGKRYCDDENGKATDLGKWISDKFNLSNKYREHLYDTGANPIVNDLQEEEKKQINGSILLLHGLSGSGKSLFAQKLSKSIWENYHGKKNDWLTLVIPLIAFKRKEGKLVEHYLGKKNFSPKHIEELRQKVKYGGCKLLLVLDGYDELNTSDNLCKTHELFNKTNWGDNVHIIITCRTEILRDDVRERKEDFGFGDIDYQECHITAFDDNKIEAYLKQYVKVQSQEQKLYDYGWYLQKIKSISGLRNLVHSPLLLGMIVEILPSIVDGLSENKKDGTSKATRISKIFVYEKFLQHWYKQAKKKLGRTADIFIKKNKNFEKSLKKYTEKLACDMYRESLLSVDYEPSDTDFDDDEEATKQSAIFSKYFKRGKKKTTDALCQAAPIRQKGNSYSFVHKSIWDYLIASKMHKEMTKSAEKVVQNFGAYKKHSQVKIVKNNPESAVLINMRLLTKDPALITVLAEWLDHEDMQAKTTTAESKGTNNNLHINDNEKEPHELLDNTSEEINAFINAYNKRKQEKLAEEPKIKLSIRLFAKF
ncbi:MAG: hypothetical protein COB50_05400, partial [Thiotrichales bacterium]